MKHETWWDAEHCCARLRIVGELSPADARLIAQQLTAILAGRESPRAVIDHRESPGPLSGETRAALQADLGASEVDKMAFFGMTNLNRIVAKIITAISGKGTRVAFFANEAEALAWICDAVE